MNNHDENTKKKQKIRELKEEIWWRKSTFPKDKLVGHYGDPVENELNIEIEKLQKLQQAIQKNK